MAGFKRTVTITYGFVQAVADLTSSKVTEKESDLTQLCAGACGQQHDPAKPNWDPQCSVSGKVVKRGMLVKGSEVSKDSYAVFTPEEIAALKADEDQYKGTLALVACDAADVEAQTMPSGTTYYLAPNPKDNFFGLLRQMIVDTPDLAFVGLYTVTSRSAMYRVRPYGDILVAEQLLRPDEMQPAPSVPVKDVPQQMVDMAREVAAKFVQPFDPASFASTYRQRLSEAIDARQATPGAALPTTVGPTAVADPMAAMLAQMTAMIGTGSDGAPVADQKPAPRKRTTKKKVVAA